MRRRLFLKSCLVLLVLAAAAAAAAYWYLRQSLPMVAGVVSVQGLTAPIDIIRDADGIPHIMATGKADAFFGLGYVHAQDRLWQMELQRRIGHGRLAEIFGSAALPQDRFLRTVGFGRAARSAWDRLPADTRTDLTAYIAGVNAFIATHHGRLLPPEFSLLRFEPEPWTGADVIVWVKMMAWDLSANYSTELFRHDLIARVGAGKAAQLMPPYPADGPTIVKGDRPHAPAEPHASAQTTLPSPLIQDAAGSPAASWSTAFSTAVAAGHPGVGGFLLGGATTEALGSNNWVVDGTLTASGKPLLANDPHLGTHIPSLWYLAHLSAGDFDVIGATLPGAPAVAIGRNRHIAWGETNVGADVQDLYVEKLDSAGLAAEFKGAFEALRIVSEEIKVKGADPVTIEVRISRHGPLISDAINANNAALRSSANSAAPSNSANNAASSNSANNAAAGGSADNAAPSSPVPPSLEPLAFRWTALDDEDSTVVAFLKLNEARNWSDFTAAMREFVTPAQNFVYADVDGHIGYFLPGRIPIRAGGDGTSPASGWTGDQEWIGWIPFDDLPQLFDPPDHVIVTANHRPNPQGDASVIALEYPEPYRAQRIATLVRELRGPRGLTPDDFRTMQADTHSLHAEALLPLLLRTVDATDQDDRDAVDLLRSWNYNATGDSGAAAIFEAWFLHLAPAIAGDDLGARLLEGYRGRYSYITRFVVATLTQPDGTWCDDRATDVKETCRQAVTRALHDGVASLKTRLGGNLRSWRWDAVHPAVFPHQGLDAVAFLRPILNRSVPNGGDWSTVNVGAVAADHQYEQRAIPGYRQIVDLSPANDSRFLDAVGQSGHFLSPHYDDFLTSWQAVQHRPMRMERVAIESGAIGTLRLLPQ